jgi:DNA primase catalytic subunit
VDHYLRYKPHRHDLQPDRICLGCLQTAKELAMEALDVIMENHSDVHTVFSGHRGFHIHVLDFDVRDYTIYMPSNPLKSHEVARFLYTERLKKQGPDCFNSPDFIVSCDDTRVITVPESLNAMTGLVASYLGTAHDFMELSVEDIVSKARSKKHITEGLKWITADTWKTPRFNLLHSSL